MKIDDIIENFKKMKDEGISELKTHVSFNRDSFQPVLNIEIPLEVDEA